MTGALWIVQDGVLSGPGASQVIPYVTGLAGEGFRMCLLSFEREAMLADRDRVRDTAAELSVAGVRWARLPYGRGPAAIRTSVQVARAVATGDGLLRKEGIELVHARSYLPALMALCLRRPFLFDMRGLWPRERVDGGIWGEGSLPHRVGSGLERRLLDRARGVVVLANGAKEHLPEIPVPLKVIPTAVDTDLFRPGLPVPEGGAHLVGKNVFVIAGALGTWYLLEEMLDLAALALADDGNAHLLVLTEEDPGGAIAGLRRRGVAPERMTVRGVAWREVPNWFSLAAAGILLIKSAPSKRASAPTKLAEFLASGAPVVISPRIGDTERLLKETRTGVVVKSGTRESHVAALQELAKLREVGGGLAARCRRTAVERLSLTSAVRDYADLYRTLEVRPCG